jgi:hypothetical protein
MAPIISFEGVHLVQGLEQIITDKRPALLENIPNEPIWAWCLFTMHIIDSHF